MKVKKTLKLFLNAFFTGLCIAGSATALAEATEQRVWVDTVSPGNGAQCEVRAEFKGDQDNCKNDAAKGRSDCSKDQGCVCTRKEKKIQWSLAKGNDKSKGALSIAFNQGSDNPFVQKGSDECNFMSNKEGNLRCQVKGKDVPSGIYRYSIAVAGCKPLVAQIKIY